MKDNPYLSNLTPLRGVAALLVMLFHADLFMKPDTGILVNLTTSLFIRKGYLMVDFFFVLSGFIMAYVYYSRFIGQVKKSAYFDFLKARLGRIYPLHIITLGWIVVVFLVLLWTGNYTPDPISELHNNFWALPSQLFLLHSMHLHNFTTWNGPSWSISVEWWMYVLFPFLVPFIARAGIFSRVLIALTAWAGMWWIVLYLNPAFPLPLPFPIPPQYTLDVTADFGFLRCLCGFVIGVLTYLVYQDGWGKKIIANSVFLFTTVVIAAVLMHVDAFDTFTVLAFPTIILSAAYNESGLASKIFTSKPLQWLGNLSYSMYLTHVPVWATAWAILKISFPAFNPAVTTLNAWIISGVWIVLTLLTSMVTYRFIEVPGRRWIRNWTASRSSVDSVLQKNVA